MSQILGPFQAELLSFLREDTEKRILREELDPATDPKLKQFQTLLQEAPAFPELIEQYHALLSGCNTTHLEKELLAAFPQKESGMRIYRGLPRLYRIDSPAQSRVKKSFLHLPLLKRLVAEKELFRLYASAPISSTARISLLTWVQSEGLDDYLAGFASIELLRKKFPDLELIWIVFLPDHFGAPILPQGVKTHPIFYNQEMSVSRVGREALEMLRTSDLVLQIPTFYPAFEPLQKAVGEIDFSRPPPVWSSMGKYGSIDSSQYHPGTKNRSMGLHFLEKGLLIPNMEPSQLGSQQMLDWLFEGGALSESGYRKNHHFYFASLSSPIGGAVYLHALLQAHERDAKGIDLCTPNLHWLIAYIDMQTRLGRPVLEVEGVAIEIYFQDKFVPMRCNNATKKVRIFCPETVSPSDMRALLALSEEFIGVSDDQLLSEAVALGKGFFYDGRVGRSFVKDLLALAENRIGGCRSTLEIFRGMGKVFQYLLAPPNGEWVDESYFQETEEWVKIGERVGKALRDPEVLQGFKKICRIIIEEHSVNDFLCHLVERELYLREHPSIAVVEEESLRHFAQGDCSFQQLLNELKRGRP